MKIAFYTLGCKVNQYETEALKEQFEKSGYTVTDEEDSADVYVINTCTVTNLSDRKSRQYIRRVKRRSPKAMIAVTGCYAQTSPEEVAAVEGVDIVVGNGEKSRLKDIIEDIMSRGASKALDGPSDDDGGWRGSSFSAVTPFNRLTEYKSSGVIMSMESRTRAYIKIEEGCDRFCSYCVIPYARGPVRSRDMEEIIEEAGTLIGRGFKELILTGINTALYGADRPKKGSLFGILPLIEAINGLDGDFRIRLSSLEPTVINGDYVRSLLGFDKLCHHLHLSVQSGSDRILKRMNRHYTAAEYMDIVKILKEFDPLYGITTDIITGFPGETEAAFGETLALVEAAGFCRVHPFRYSKRRGTKAAEMEDQIPGSVKNERLSRLVEKADKAASEFYRKCRGSVRRVLFEERTEEGLLTGYSDNYVRVYAEGPDGLLGQLKDVRLLREYRDGMKGETAHE